MLFTVGVLFIVAMSVIVGMWFNAVMLFNVVMFLLCCVGKLDRFCVYEKDEALKRYDSHLVKKL